MSDVTVSILTFILRSVYTFRVVTRPSDAARPIPTLTVVVVKNSTNHFTPKLLV